jgi:hypothetical protein
MILSIAPNAFVVQGRISMQIFHWVQNDVDNKNVGVNFIPI